MPQELELVMTYTGIVTEINWTVSAAEEAVISDFFTGVFLLQFLEYSVIDSIAYYAYYYPDPPYSFTVPGFAAPSQIRVGWKCDEFSSGTSGSLSYYGCTSSSVTVKQFNSLLSPQLSYPDFTDIKGYCSGVSLSGSLTVLTTVSRNAVCLNPTSATQRVNFNVDVDIAAA